MSTHPQSRQPKGTPVGGQFGAGVRAENDADLTGTPVPGPEYSTWEPSDVDAELYRLYGEHGTAMHRFDSMWSSLNTEVAHAVLRRGWNGTATHQEVTEAVESAQARILAGTSDYTDRDVVRHYDAATSYRDQADALAEQMVPLNDEFERRNGWTRAFLVSNANGHVHSSMSCSTCFSPGPTRTGGWRQGTRYHWVTEMSDKTEDEVVEAAGERACTVCYPSAPVETLRRPTQLFTPEEVDRAAERERRAAAKIEKDKEKVAKALTVDGSPFTIAFKSHGGRWDARETFKTQRAASQWLVSQLVDQRHGYRAGTELHASQVEAERLVLEALAAKRGISVKEMSAEIDKSVAAKAKRDGYTG